MQDNSSPGENERQQYQSKQNEAQYKITKAYITRKVINIDGMHNKK